MQLFRLRYGVVPWVVPSGVPIRSLERLVEGRSRPFFVF